MWPTLFLGSYKKLEYNWIKLLHLVSIYHDWQHVVWYRAEVKNAFFMKIVTGVTVTGLTFLVGTTSANQFVLFYELLSLNAKCKKNCLI